MDQDKELLSKFIDGELSPEEMARVAELLIKHPDLNAYVRNQEFLRSELRARFLEIGEPVPDRLLETVRMAPVSWRWFLRRLLSREFLTRRFLPVGAALAAGLVIGIAVRPGSNFGTDASGRLVATNALGRVLDTQLASAGPAAQGPEIGISFRSKSGRNCRTFSSGADAGLACHVGGSWVIETLVKHAPEDANAAYRMAGSDMPEAVRRAVMTRIAGNPFDAAAEARARDHGWSGH